MILYITYNDQPSGVYWSQVTDVVDHLNSLGGDQVRLVALVSMRGYRRSYRAIKTHDRKAWVVPMVPRAHNWSANLGWLAVICRLYRPAGIIARGVFATALAFRLRKKGLVHHVCYDGRGAYGVEWEEYRVVDDDDLIEQCKALEADAVERSDMRLAVSEALVEHWRERYGYTGSDHVVIPCTLGSDHARSHRMDADAFRRSLGWDANDLVLVYSGSTGGWQSLDLLAHTLDRILSSDRNSRVLFLSGRDGYIDHLAQRHPDQVAQRWLPYAQVNGALAACDVGLLVRSPSGTNKVASPTKFAEYLNAGLPVLISAHIGDLSRIVQENGLGWIHDLRTTPPLRKPSPEERKRLKAFSITHFTKAAYNDQYRKILDRLSPVPASDRNSQALVTIVVPSFNKIRYIGEMIASVRAQSHVNWELLFIDDASTDGTQQMIVSIAKEEPRIRLHFLPQNRGANHCRNLGITMARGEYVIFLDADDLLGPHCLRDRLSVAEKEQLDLCVFTMEVFKGKKGDSTHRWIPSSKDPLADFFRHKLPWSVMQPIWRRSFLERIGGFDESFKRHQDVEFHTRALLEPGVRFRTVVGEPDCFYRISEERKVLEPYALLDGFAESSLDYHSKFLTAAKEQGRRSMILGIIYQTYLQILLNFKNKVIGEQEFRTLEEKLFGPGVRREMNMWERNLFKLARTYNLLPLRIPGINMMIYRAITG